MRISLRNMFKNASFRQKLTLTYMLAILAPLVVLVTVLAVTMTRTNEDNMKSLSMKIHNQGLHYVNSLAESMRFTASVIYFDEPLLHFFMRTDQSVSTQQAMFSKLSSSLYIIARNNRMERIRLFVDGGYIFSNEQKNFFNLSEAFRRGWLAGSMDKPYSKWTADTYNLQNLDRIDTITLVTSMTNMNRYDKCTAILAVDVLKSAIAAQLGYFVGTTNECDMYLVDDGGAIVCGSSAPNTGGIPVLDDEHRWVRAKIAGKTSWLYSSPTSMQGWRLVTVLHDNAIARSGGQSLAALFVTAVAVTVVVLVITVYVSKLNTQRINRLTAYAARVQAGDLTPTSEDYGTDEIGHLCDAFNYTIRILSQSVMEQQQSLERAKNAEIRSVRSDLEVLQTQINPHFLYNTLSVINWTAAKYGCKEVESQILMLARYYKGCLSRGETLVAIQSEVETAQLYVKLQNLRSGFDIRLETDIDTVSQYRIPKMTIQPLIENSIIHGILPKDSKKGTITIRGTREGSLVRLAIIDDGVGYDPGDPPESSSSGGYGIGNVLSRLRMYCGDECSLRFEPDRQQGTAVLLTFKAAEG